MKISIIGSGHVAYQLAGFFHKNGHCIAQVYSRTPANGFPLAGALSAQYISSLTELKDDLDMILIAISDIHIAEIVAQIKPSHSATIVHTSGATPLDVLAMFKKYGVIYPPQSIRKDVDIDLSNVPFAVEGSTNDVTKILLDFMRAMSPKSFECSTKQRLTLHLAAVFANNFTNAMYQIAYDLLQTENLDFSLLHPIIAETAQKTINHIPKDVQTGPAVRNDIQTINKHLQFLSNNPVVAEIYQQLTGFIIKSK